MKRILVILVFVGVVAAGAWAVWYLLQPPISYDEMARIQENGAQGVKDIPRLLACFERNNEDLRVQAALTLSKIGGPAVAPVRAQLHDNNPKVRFYAVETLAWIGPDAAPAALDVRNLLNDPNADVRRKAAYALGRLDVKTMAVTDSLIEALHDPDPDVSSTAKDALEQLGPTIGPRVYQLLAANEGPARDRILAVCQTMKIGPPTREALPVLVELVHGPNPQQQIQAIGLLGHLGEPAVPTFKDLLAKGEPINTSALVNSIIQLGPHAKGLLPELRIYLSKGTWWISDPMVIGVFKQHGPEGARNLTDFFEMLQNAKKRPAVALPDERYLVLLKALGEMGSDAKVAVPALVALLKDEPLLRACILETLGDIGPAARAAIPDVEALANEPLLAETARTTLRRMGVVRKD